DLGLVRRQILRIVRGHAVRGLRHQGAVAVVGVGVGLGAGGGLRQIVGGVIAIAGGAVVGQIAGIIIGPAHHLVRRVVGVGEDRGAVHRDPGPVPGQVVAVGKAAPRRLYRAGQPLQPAILVTDGLNNRAN